MKSFPEAAAHGRILCAHWHGGRCAHDYGSRFADRRVNLRICLPCRYYEGPPRGLGDAMHAAAGMTGVAAVIGMLGGCGGCERRRADWNAASIARRAKRR